MRRRRPGDELGADRAHLGLQHRVGEEAHLVAAVAAARTATDSVGGMLPPPAERANRKRLMSILLQGLHDGEDDGEQLVVGGRAGQAHVAAQDLPDVDVGGDDEARDRALTLALCLPADGVRRSS